MRTVEGMDEELEREQRWQHLPERVLPEQMTMSHPTEPGLDSTPEIDLERYWLNRTVGVLGI